LTLLRFTGRTGAHNLAWQENAASAFSSFSTE
jgi:hypothetical protein